MNLFWKIGRCLLFTLFMGLFDTGFGLNVASQSNGGSCRASAGSCGRAIDDIIHESFSFWYTSGPNPGFFIEFNFNSTYVIHKIVVRHFYNYINRNCKQFSLSHGKEEIMKLNMTNREEGYFMYEEFSISPPYFTSSLKLICVEVYNSAIPSIYEEIEMHSVDQSSFSSTKATTQSSSLKNEIMRSTSMTESVVHQSSVMSRNYTAQPPRSLSQIIRSTSMTASSQTEPSAMTSVGENNGRTTDFHTEGQVQTALLKEGHFLLYGLYAFVGVTLIVLITLFTIIMRKLKRITAKGLSQQNNSNKTSSVDMEMNKQNTYETLDKN